MTKLDLYWQSNSDWWELKNHIPVVKKDAPPEAQESYKRYLEQLKKKKHWISDIIDGLSDGKVIGYAQHSITNPDYWKELGRLEREVFANMYASCFDSEAAKYMSEYFPEAYKEFKKMIKELWWNVRL